MFHRTDTNTALVYVTCYHKTPSESSSRRVELSCFSDRVALVLLQSILRRHALLESYIKSF